MTEPMVVKVWFDREMCVFREGHHQAFQQVQNKTG